MIDRETLLTYRLTDTERGLQGSKALWLRAAPHIPFRQRAQVDAAIRSTPEGQAVRVLLPREVADRLLDAMARG